MGPTTQLLVNPGGQSGFKASEMGLKWVQASEMGLKWVQASGYIQVLGGEGSQGPSFRLPL
jgi:hypothetical protein